MFDHPHSKEIFPDIQPEHPMVQLCVIHAHRVFGYQGEEISTSLSNSSPLEFAESNEVASQPSFLQTR